LAVLNLDLFLGRYDYVKDLVFDVHRLDPLFEIPLYPVFLTGVGVDDVPAAAFIDDRLLLCGHASGSDEEFSQPAESVVNCAKKHAEKRGDDYDEYGETRRLLP
jgi:hypothetical protein